MNPSLSINSKTKSRGKPALQMKAHTPSGCGQAHPHWSFILSCSEYQKFALVAATNCSIFFFFPSMFYKFIWGPTVNIYRIHTTIVPSIPPPYELIHNITPQHAQDKPTSSRSTNTSSTGYGWVWGMWSNRSSGLTTRTSPPSRPDLRAPALEREYHPQVIN